MPKLWNETIEAHRRTVRDAILDTTAALVAERGLLGVTMSQIAEQTGIGRATLYKYFPAVETIVLVWHDRRVAEHLKELVTARDHAGGAEQRLEAVLRTYAHIQRERGHHGEHESFGADVFAALHKGEYVARAHQELDELLRDVLAGAAEAGHVRADVPADELAAYCRHALQAAAAMPSKAAVQRLLEVVMAGMRP
ncbi:MULTISPECIES: TetR/AcrR family transcriptional regulator [unclassified Nonomuraea]|uniref:TetR/AcrR family transcriptional regulator n=1 Tax=unclassified Nonomuraea TaxID=2593643 RepID=UPI00340EAA33